MLKRLFATRSSISRSYNYSVLTQAIASGDVDRAIAVMISSPELINDNDKFGNSALHVAVQMESEILVSELIARGAKFDSINFLGFSPFSWAAKIGWKRGMKLLTSSNLEAAQNSLFNVAVSDRTYKKLRYKLMLFLFFGFLIYTTYWYTHFFIDAEEMVDHGVPTSGIVTSIYSGTTAGLAKRPYQTATVTYLGGYKIYINGENLHEGEGISLTYSEIHPHMATISNVNDSIFDYAAWRSESYLHLTLYLAVIALLWGIWIACFKSYWIGKPVSGAELNDFFVEDNLLIRILGVIGISRLFKNRDSKSKISHIPMVTPTLKGDVLPVTCNSIEGNVANDVSDKLRQIQKLFHEGIITEAEFNEKKGELLKRF